MIIFFRFWSEFQLNKEPHFYWTYDALPIDKMYILKREKNKKKQKKKTIKKIPEIKLKLFENSITIYLKYNKYEFNIIAILQINIFNKK